MQQILHSIFQVLVFPLKAEAGPAFYNWHIKAAMKQWFNLTGEILATAKKNGPLLPIQLLH